MITAATSKVSYAGNGAAVEFAIPYVFLENSHLVVTLLTDATGVEVTKVITTHYTVVGAGLVAGGTLTMLAAPGVGETLTINRVVPITQLTDYIANDAFPAETHEAALDKLTMICQYLYDIVQRSLKYPISETLGDNMVIPAIGIRPNTLMGFDASGDFVLMELDADALELIAPVGVDTAQIVDLAVTVSKLADVLDLSSKTVTLPAGSVTAAMMEDDLDFATPNHNMIFPASSIVMVNIAGENVVSDKIRKYLRLKQISVNDEFASMKVEDSGIGNLNGIELLYVGEVLGRHSYEDASTRFTLSWLGDRWSIHDDNIAVVSAYYSLDDVQTPDQCIKWSRHLLAPNPVPNVVFHGELVNVVGNVKATGFIGSGAQLTDLPIDESRSISTLPDMKGGCLRVSDRATYLINPSRQLLSCGLNTNGKLGIGNTAASQVAQPRFSMFLEGQNAIDGVTNFLNNGVDTVVKVVLRDNNAFALTASGILYACGNNSSGQCGQGNTTQYNVFKAIRFGGTPSTNKVIASFSIADGVSAACHCLAIDVDGQVWVWGENAHGQLGIDNTTQQNVPVKLSTSTALNAADWVTRVATQVLAIAGDRGASYILTNDGKAWSCGRNQHGQLGQGNTTDLDNFTQIGAFTNIAELYGGGDYNSGGAISYGNLYVRLNDDTIYGCGSNANGQLGIGTTVNSNSLVVVTGLGAVSQFYPFGGRQKWCFAVKTNGAIAAWGSNAVGHLGDGTTTDRTSIITPTGIDAIATANGGVKKIIGTGDIVACNTYILFNNGVIYVAGGNTKGQCCIGHNTSPQMTFLKSGLSHSLNTDVAPVSQEAFGNCIALRSDKTVWSAGYNTSQHLAVGDSNADDVYVATRMQL